MAAASAWIWRRGGRDPLRVLVLVVLWALLALFVLYPLVELVRRALSDDSGFTFAPLAAAIDSRSNLRAFANSLLLATLVGVCGTFFGFLFALTVERTQASLFWVRLLDVVTVLPLISPLYHLYRVHIFVRTTRLHHS
jgi:iron(III) transport system permease protein